MAAARAPAECGAGAACAMDNSELPSAPTPVACAYSCCTACNCAAVKLTEVPAPVLLLLPAQGVQVVTIAQTVANTARGKPGQHANADKPCAFAGSENFTRIGLFVFNSVSLLFCGVLSLLSILDAGAGLLGLLGCGAWRTGFETGADSLAPPGRRRELLIGRELTPAAVCCRLEEGPADLPPAAEATVEATGRGAFTRLLGRAGWAADGPAAVDRLRATAAGTTLPRGAPLVAAGAAE